MSNDQAPTMYALMVGIDQYKAPNSIVPDLGGCVNDVAAMAQLLQDKFEVPKENIEILTNEAATHAAIKAAFKRHLVDRARAWATSGQTGKAPVFLFHYSGHGSQALDETGLEPDGLDETMVPHDSRVGDVYDIKDWELGQLIDELTEPFTEDNANVTIILDCCHSGSGTRDIKPSLVPTRRCEPDLRPQPSQRPTGGVTGTRSVSAPSGWSLGGKYVLLAGCRDREEANEYVVSQGAEGRQHGAMTYFMLQALNQMAPARRLTYRELHERVRYQVNSRYESQMPQCEGSKDREIFGGLKPLDDVLLSVDKIDDYIWVNGGAAHGLTEGSQLHVYPPGTTSLKEAGEPKTTLYVEEVGAVRSGCLIETGEPVELHSRVAIAHIDHSQLQHRVALDIADDNLRQTVEALLSDESVQPYIQLLSSDQPESGDLRIQQLDDSQVLVLQDATGKPLVAAFPPDKRHELPSDLVHIARYYNALNLTNPSGELAGLFEVGFKKLRLEAGQAAADEIPLNAEDELELVVGEKIVVEVTNRADTPLYVAIFNFAHDWSINQLYPGMAGAGEALEPGQTISLGLSPRRKEQLQPGLDDGINEAREFVKVIATVEQTDFELLQMRSLKTAGQTRSIALGGSRSPLTALLEQAAQGSGKRAIGTPPSTSEDEWTTTEVQFRLVRPLEDKEISRSLQGGSRTSLPSYALEIEPPAGFQGQIRVLTARQNTRSVTGELTDLVPPPAFAAFRQNFAPVNVLSKGTRNIDPGGAVIELEADDASRAAVTEQTPLKLHLPEGMTGEGEAMLALAYDGSFFYPVGRPGEAANSLNIEWLPEVMPDEEIPTRSTRSLGRTTKLYLFKMAGWPEPSLGLHQARLVPTARIYEVQPTPDEYSYAVEGGEARYRPLKAGELQSDQRIALFVHGFNSETRWMVNSIQPWLEANDLGYDHYLTFDYDTFSTHISDNGQILAKDLQAAGFGPDDGLHLDVFAHSMGTQVVRSMVELHGGDEFVDRCFLAGSPNMGTRLAEAKRLVPWLGTLLLNQAGPTPPALIASWALKKVTNDAVGGDDLRPGSDFYKQLNSSDKPAKVPYYILAGRHELSAEYKSVWDRVAKTLVGAADAGLDMLFGDQHDLVINVQSMLKVRDGNYPLDLLQTQVLPCNHFQYFSDELGQATLLAWLKG